MTSSHTLTSPGRVRGITLVILATVFWSTSGIFISLILQSWEIGVVSLAFWRDLSTFLTLLAGIAILRPSLLRVKRKDLGWLMAMGAVALESILAAEADDFWQRMILGGVGEGLMVAASRQYIKAWEVETGVAHTEAAWYLAEALWRASSEMQPELEAEQRWQAIEALLAPAYDPDVPAPDKALLL